MDAKAGAEIDLYMAAPYGKEITCDGFTFSEYGITGSADVTHEAFQKALRSCVRHHSMLSLNQWYIGDLLNIGEDVFGEEVYQFLDDVVAVYGQQTLLNYKSIAKNVPPHIRLPIHVLSWSAHRVVAYLKTEEDKVYWLNLAASEGWGAAELHKEIREIQIKEELTRADDDIKPQLVECIEKTSPYLNKIRDMVDKKIPIVIPKNFAEWWEANEDEFYELSARQTAELAWNASRIEAKK